MDKSMDGKSRIATTLVSFFVCLLFLSACSSNTQVDSDKTRSTAPTPAATSQPFVNIKTRPGGAGQYQGAARDATVESCKYVDKGWHVIGSVRNSEAEPKSYRIYVSLLGNDSSVAALQEIDVDAAQPKVATKWNIVIPTDKQHLSCSLRVERY